MPRRIRVLAVDDSPLIRELIRDTIATAPDLELVGTAADGDRAVTAVRRLQPDVVTLDIQMPGCDGFQALERLLAERPLPIVMVSSLTQRGAIATIEALERGALDCIAKPQGHGDGLATLSSELLTKIRAVAGCDVRRILAIRAQRQRCRLARAAGAAEAHPTGVAARARPTAAQAETRIAELAQAVVAIGISTGGPPALVSLFESLQPPQPPIVIVQHMPARFTAALAARLDARSPLSVKEAAEGDRLTPNVVYLAPGGRHLELRGGPGGVRTRLGDGPPVSGHRPSIDVLMQSAAAACGRRTLGVIMTGMGRDGVAGCQRIRAAGGMVLAQDEETSDVYGMNKAAVDEGHVDRQFALEHAAFEITRAVGRLTRAAGR